MSRALDSHTRTLTADERRDLERLRPGLDAWRAYLDKVAAVGDFDEAERRQAPILSRVEAVNAPLGYSPVIVNPRYALRWAQGHGMGGRAGTGSTLTYSTMVAALDFMRATPATTFRARNDSCERRRRPGYYHLTVHLVWRLRGNVYVPVLTRRPGRPRSNDVVQPAPGATARAIRRAAGDESLSIVRHWLQVSEPTALLCMARDQGRPLAIRAPGRPAVHLYRGPQVQADVLVGHTDTLVNHAAEFGQWRIPSPAELTAALTAHAQATPGVVSSVARFSTPDAPGQRNLRGWWRFTLSAFGRRALDPADLGAEVDYHLAMVREAAQREPAPVEASRDFHGLTLPAGCDPQYLDDPDYRVMHGVTDEDYERWKAGG